jgi:hypothetical protein
MSVPEWFDNAAMAAASNVRPKPKPMARNTTALRSSS